MKPGRAFALLALVVFGFAPLGSSRAVDEEGGEGSDQTLPPLKLAAADRKILAARHHPPRTAADYYFLLPASYFSIVENSPERRATFIRHEALSDTYLEAGHFFECDGGGFAVTIRVFESPTGPIVAIAPIPSDPDILLSVKKPKPGQLKSIMVNRPEFWRYEEGAWRRAKDVKLPLVSKADIVDQYRNRFHAHLEEPSQEKFIYLDYELPRTGDVVNVVGRENFMDSAPTWASFKFDGKKFKRLP